MLNYFDFMGFGLWSGGSGPEFRFPLNGYFGLLYKLQTELLFCR